MLLFFTHFHSFLFFRERYHAIPRVENEHSVYTGWDSNSLGFFVYYMPSIAVTTAKVGGEEKNVKQKKLKYFCCCCFAAN